MHQKARSFIERQTAGQTYGRVVEFGSLYINGQVKDLIDCDEYLGIDRIEGRGVDEVTELSGWRTRKKYDLVICCEVLEHTKQGRAVVKAAADAMNKDGRLLLTCATDPRPPHSGLDGSPLDGQEYYGNVDPDDLRGWLEDAGLTIDLFEVHDDRGDLYVAAH